MFGREFAFGSTRCEIASNSAPDSSRAKVVTLARWDTDVLGGLRHSLYDHPECVPQIVLWPAEEGVIGDLETKTQGHGCGTWAEAWKTGASCGGDPVATREGCMPVSSRQLRASSEGRPNAKAPLLSRRIPAAGISSS